MLTIVRDEDGFAVSVFKGNNLIWCGKAEYLEEFLISQFKIAEKYVPSLFMDGDWNWDDAYQTLEELDKAHPDL